MALAVAATDAPLLPPAAASIAALVVGVHAWYRLQRHNTERESVGAKKRLRHLVASPDARLHFLLLAEPTRTYFVLFGRADTRLGLLFFIAHAAIYAA